MDQYSQGRILNGGRKSGHPKLSAGGQGEAVCWQFLIVVAFPLVCL